eukprot:TRINITY_DN11492_c2_g1_i1.p1 TRINITY_DN11492_c2_g1~~TRINITY_DN11492_c2_g1_i1.p1  ORF type:complete len:637 (+),score=131.53 TRINITY_DN11492_c2_g1_i1:134-2044(+)
MASIVSFGAFAADMNPIASLDHSRYKLVAESYLYRFSPQVPREMLFGLIDDLYRDWRSHHIQTSPEHSCPLPRESFQTRILCNITRAASVYFEHHWDNLEILYDINRPSYLKLIQSELTQRSRPKRTDKTSPLSPAEADDHNGGWHPNIALIESFSQLDDLLSAHERVLVMFTADYCRFCHLLQPVINKMSADLSGSKLKIGVVYGPQHLELRDRFAIKLYPTLLLFVAGDLRAEYPREAERTDTALLEFCHDAKWNAVARVERTSSFSSDPDVKPSGYTTNTSIQSWQNALAAAGIDMLDSLQLARQRAIEQHKHAVRQQIHSGPASPVCTGDSCPINQHSQAHVPPVVVFTGGGIASGKSTILNVFYGSDFWKQHHNDFVSIEADAIKTQDPLFQALKGVGQSNASTVVHGRSVSTAEDLLLEAVNARQSVVLDGTMMWAPFVQQTVAMIRDADWIYRKGAGYIEHEDGSTTEEYWVRDRRRSESTPRYVLVMLGVVLEPLIAIQRATVRWITTGRAPSSARHILKSHRWFAQHAHEYCNLMDQAIVVDGKLRINSCPDPDVLPSPLDAASFSLGDKARELIPLLAGGKLPHTAAVVLRKTEREADVEVVHADLERRLMAVKEINVDATCAAEL